jgi:hypothetical protein
VLLHALWALLVPMHASVEPATAARIAVAELAIEGDLVAARRQEAARRVLDALARGGHDIVAIGPATAGCADDACRRRAAADVGATWLVLPKISVEPGARDYEVELVALDVDSGDRLAQADGACELCGFEDAMGTFEAEAADLLAALDRGAAPSTGTLQIATAPAGARLRIDGTEVGSAPQAVELAPGRHEIVATLAGHTAQTLQLEVIGGVSKAIDIQLVRVPAAPLPRGNGLVVAGSIATGVGTLAAIAGGVLLAFDGDPYRRECQSDLDGDCRYLRDTFTGGVTLLVGGGAVAIAGVAMLGSGLVRRRRARAQPRVTWIPGTLGGRF